MKETFVTEGIAAFINLASTEIYNGKDTEKFSIVLNMDQDEADKLRAKDVIVKEYKNVPQRKFASKWDVPVFEVDDSMASKHIPYGSKVRVLWEKGDPHPVHKTIPYLKKVRVLEYAEGVSGEGKNEDF